jgi:hypothetical protein
LVLVGAILLTATPMVTGDSDLPDLRSYDIQRLSGKTFVFV